MTTGAPAWPNERKWPGPHFSISPLYADNSISRFTRYLSGQRDFDEPYGALISPTLVRVARHLSKLFANRA